ncbi:PP2C family protein-serine/threonine phosphatase [Tranquillimonas rosea]|uniref:PP2C family protein-serine/threonine phosphatase n=1 Tax=Tranquillimonas rosea TaxID=641238 RepID=UPI003BAC5E16
MLTEAQHDRPETTAAEAVEGVRTVLVVDDSALQRKLLALSLTRWGYAVLEAGSGVEALDMCAHQRVDLILSDWVMDGMSGLDLCKTLRARAGQDYVYFILLTSRSESCDIAEGLDAGADDYLAKPVHGEELRARIAAADRLVRMGRELRARNRVVSSTLAQLQSLYSALDRDLAEARKLQHSLLRERSVSVGPVEGTLTLKSCGHVGGDMVGHFRADDGRVGFWAIDVSGHGIAPALLTARLAGFLSPVSADQNVALETRDDGRRIVRDLGEIGTRLNTLMLEDLTTEHYFTMVLCVVESGTGQVDLLLAGHPLPLVQRTSGGIERLGTGGMPMGLLPAPHFDRVTTRLGQGDRLLIVSDGVTECMDAAGGLLGESGVAASLERSRTLSGQALFDALMWDVADHSGTDDLTDDLSGILIEYGRCDQPRPK